MYLSCRFAAILFLGTCAYGLTACTSPCTQLDSQITDALDDNLISTKESAGLVAFISDPANDFTKKCSNLRTANGKPDKATLLAFIQKNKTYWKQRQKNGQPPIVEGLATETVRGCLGFCFTDFPGHDSYHCPLDKCL